MKILVFPYDKNPYQRLLYGAMQREYGSTFRITYAWFLPFIGALHLPLELAVRRLLGYRIVHIHWVAFYLKLPVPGRPKLSWYSTRYTLWVMKKLGYKIVWTVHNITPHQPETSDDNDIARRLAAIADMKIVHSNFTLEQMKANRMATTNHIVIPHGNYDGRYPDTISRDAARASLGIPADKLVFLFFGIIKDYKGVDELLLAYAKVRTAQTMLVIVGTCSDERLTALLLEAGGEADIVVRNEYIKDEDVALYFKVSDAVCLPFKSITTSGSVLLALTFAKPLIAPRAGSLNDLPASVGYLYAANAQNGLEQALKKTIAHPEALHPMSQAARSYADTLAWERIAQTTYRMYERLIS